jgi:hypothetical protein
MGLPTRVLELSGTSAAPIVRLIESKGKKDQYVALSHCWGPISKRPLHTTRLNLADYLVNIPFERLPKTFRDTVILALGLEFRYLWIDSLCIIQDDTLDWDSEAKDMRNVYRNATLVVAASGAVDSTQGLFITERSHVSTWRVPYIIKGLTHDSFNIALLPRKLGTSPSQGPLARRAWAFQERYLARRLIFFMPDNIYWKCSNLELHETCTSQSLNFLEKVSWIHLLDDYSSKISTYPSDRIHALQGIITELETIHQDQFMHKYGIWERQIHEQILWRQKGPLADADSLTLPSWSWAATGGKKDWCTLIEDLVLEHLPKVFEVSAHGSLVVTGHSTGSLLQLGLPYNKSDVQTYVSHVPSIESFIIRYSHKHGYHPAYPILDGGSSRNVLGVAVFDRQVETSAICLFISLTERPAYDASRGAMRKSAKPARTIDDSDRSDSKLSESNTDVKTHRSAESKRTISHTVSLQLGAQSQTQVTSTEKIDPGLVQACGGETTSTNPRKEAKITVDEAPPSSNIRNSDFSSGKKLYNEHSIRRLCIGAFSSNQSAKQSTSALDSLCYIPMRLKLLVQHLVISRLFRLCINT